MGLDRGSLTVLASRVRYEEKLIMAALESRGVDCEYLDARTLFVGAGAARSRPGPVLNREIGHFRALYAAEALEAAGATVVNSAAATRLSGDKWSTTTALWDHGLPTPVTALALTTAAALEALEEIGYPAVIKPLVGSWGRMVTRVADPETAAAVLEHIDALPSPQSHVIYVQELVPKADRDIRVLVVGGKAIGATYRQGKEWRTNVARGGVSRRCVLRPDHVRLATAAAEAVGTTFAGVDLIEDEDGRLTVLEVNDRVEFRGLQEACGADIDVADHMADHLVLHMATRATLRDPA